MIYNDIYIYSYIYSYICISPTHVHTIPGFSQVPRQASDLAKAVPPWLPFVTFASLLGHSKAAKKRWETHANP